MLSRLGEAELAEAAREGLLEPLPYVPWPANPSGIIEELLRLRDGRIVKNPLIDGIQHWTQGTDPVAQALAANAQLHTSWLVPPAAGARGDFECFDLVSRHRGRYTVMAHAGGKYDRQLMNVRIPINCLAGTSQWPHRLRESLFLEQASTLDFTFRDISGLANNVALVGSGRRFLNYEHVGISREAVLRAYQERGSHPYWLSFDQIEAATGGITLGVGETRANATLNMEVPSDGDLVLVGALDDSDGDYDIEMFVGQADARASSGAMPREVFAALTVSSGVLNFPAASFPAFWAQPIYVNRRTVINYRIVNTSGAANVIRLVLFGRKLYYSEAGKRPIEFIGHQPFARPVTTQGSGNAGALPPQSAGYPIYPSFLPVPGAPGYRHP